MDILGIGFPELVLIFIIAMMVFGPRRLPEIAARVGKTVKDLRGMSQGLMTEWQREISVATRLEELEAARRDIEDVKQELQQTRRSIVSETSTEIKHVRQEMDQVKKDVEQAAE
ncbi:MAG TPA: Sec-independent protein translocase protein TatB, partial [Anaerolineae bacterium]